MKKIFLLAILIIATSQLLFAQNSIAKLKYEEAEEAYSLNNFELVLNKIKEVEILLKSTNPKLLHLKILALDQLVKQPAFKNDPELVAELLKDGALYLKKYVNLESNEEKYREVFIISETKEYKDGELLYKKAQSGDSTAQLNMAKYYESKKRFDPAIEWYEKMAFKGSIDAMYQLGFIYQLQKKDFINSVKWHEMAAAKGSKKSMVRLGETYQFGFQITPINIDKAIDWFKKAAELKSIEAMSKMGDIIIKGKRTEINGNTALEWFSKALLIKPENREDTFDLCGVYIRIIDLYYTGKALEKNYTKAEEYAKKGIQFISSENSLNANNYTAVFLSDLGDIYKAGGFGIKQDYIKAFNYYTESANKWKARPIIALGEMYQNGLGIKKDKQKAQEISNKAITYFTPRADKGNVYSIEQLVEIYEKGIGVKKDPALAKEWKAKAEAQKVKETNQ